MIFSQVLLDWYMDNRRSLPWRDHPDPYAVWVSEIMLQQTRVETVIPYFERWMARFPTITSLAQAGQQEVLNHWEGLGYYSRARNLHRAAQAVLEAHEGRLPDDVSLLKKLPGVGPYTAGAIASLAYNRDEPLVDGNVRRVLARVFDVSEAADGPEGQRRLWELAGEHLPPGRARDYNQALMELGALVCTPVSPDCSACPVSDLCLAFAKGIQAQRPVLKPKKRPPHITVTAAVIRQNGRILLAQRPQTGLLGGMWEFPGGKQEPGEDLESCLKREIDEELGIRIRVGRELGIYRHAYSHFRVTLHAFECRLVPARQEPEVKGVAAWRWVTPDEFETFPMGKIDREIARHLAGSVLPGDSDG
jgi:A/G-specific adenine glycosylase